MARGRSRSTLTNREGALVGTLPYMSPEQLGVEEIDARCDLWACGVMTIRICAGCCQRP